MKTGNQKSIRFFIHSDLHQNSWPAGRNGRYSEDIHDRVRLPDPETFDYRLIPGDMTDGIRDCKLDPQRDIPTIRVLGNHDLYGEFPNYRKAYSRANNEDIGTRWVTLNNQMIELEGGVVILGATLFTELPPHGEELLEIYTTMSDFKYAKGLTVEDWRREHAASAAFIKEMTKQQKALGKTVIVMTHHLMYDHPALHQWTPDVSRAYYTDMLKNMEVKPDYVIHGHDHHFREEVIEGVNVICNPLGYYKRKTGQFEETGYRRDFILEIPCPQ